MGIGHGIERRAGAWAWLAALIFAGAVGAAPAERATPVVDGVLDEAYWAEAQAFDHFVVTQPYSLATPTVPASARIIGLPQGIAVAIRAIQPDAATRQRAQTARDADIPGDRVNLFIDFNADGVVAYNFCVGLSGSVQDATMTNETQYSTDWDGDWQSAVREDDEGWTVEMLIPWTIARMGGADAPRRTVAVYFDRVLGIRGERSAFPGESFERQRFVSNFAHIEIDQYAAAQFNVYPYVSVLDDLVGDELESKAGLDLVWKPSGDFQLAAAINPDFGQVEADELVVNFDAVETFFSDRRPFFTENQAMFDLRTPNDGYFVYTRRIGGPDDVDGTAADIDAAVKVIGSAGALDYGVLTALESDYADDLGRAYYAQRATYPIGTATVGWLATYVDRPAIDREARVNVADVNWRPNGSVQMIAQVFGSAIDDGGDDRDDLGQSLNLFLTPPGPWRHQLELSHFGRELDFNDLGYQPRANYNELEWTTYYTDNRFDEASRVRSMVWHVEPMIRYNDEGDRLPANLYLENTTTLRSGSRLGVTAQIRSAGVDDLITRGHGDLDLPPRHSVYAYFNTPRRGDWSYDLESSWYHEGLEHASWVVELGTTYFAGDRLSFRPELEYLWGDDWLIWRRDDLLGRYGHEQMSAAFDVNWLPADRHEFRAKLQWLAIDATDGIGYRVVDGDAVRSDDDDVDDFSIRNFGLQLRYRWTFRPESDFYAVYSRGGFRESIGRGDDGIGDFFLDAFDLRDADQLLFKLRYRF